MVKKIMWFALGIISFIIWFFVCLVFLKGLLGLIISLIVPVILIARFCKRKKALCIGFACGMALVFISPFLLAFFSFRPLFYSPEQVFKHWVNNPIPADVKIISGVGPMPADWFLYVDFTVDKITFQKLAEKYRLLPCAKNNKDGKVLDMREYAAADYYFKDSFKDNLTDISDVQCYFKMGKSHSREKYYMFRDEKNNRVHFCGIHTHSDEDENPYASEDKRAPKQD